MQFNLIQTLQSQLVTAAVIENKSTPFYQTEDLEAVLSRVYKASNKISFQLQPYTCTDTPTVLFIK